MGFLKHPKDCALTWDSNEPAGHGEIIDESFEDNVDKDVHILTFGEFIGKTILKTVGSIY